MLPSHFTSFLRQNCRYLGLLIGVSCLWCLVVILLSLLGPFFPATPYLDALWMAVQLFIASQMFIPVKLFIPEPRRRSFYWFWLVILIGLNYSVNLISPAAGSFPVISAGKSALLLFSGTLVGAVLARYIDRLRDLFLVCIVMALADFSSWLAGPTAQFTEQIAAYYQTPGGPRPMIDMVLIKLALPGGSQLVPVIGVSDWVMVSFFTCAAGYFQANENLLGRSVVLNGAALPLWGRYLPVPVVVLFAVILLAHGTQWFIPVLPVLAMAMICWYLLKAKGRLPKS